MRRRWRSAAIALGLSIIGLATASKGSRIGRRMAVIAGMAVATVVTVALLSPAAYARPASAAAPANPACSAQDKYDFVGWKWAPSNNDVVGVRAPINMRTDGLLCSDAGHDAFAANWIAIVSQKTGGITQIGFDHDYNSQGESVWCRFWAIGTGVAHDYKCGVDANNTFVYFRVPAVPEWDQSILRNR